MPQNDDSDLFNRQVRLQLESLRSAGIEWIAAPKKNAGNASRIPKASMRQAADPVHTPEAPERDSPPLATQASVSPSDEEHGSGLPIEDRRRELTVLAAEIVGCQKCPELAISRTQTVFGVGALSPDLCFVGEAPGADEDAQGEPFVGMAGQLLNRIIEASGMKRADVYICNTLKCRPPGNRAPLPNESANCRDFLTRQIELVQPKFICALGTSAAQSLLGTTQTIGKLRGRFHDFHGIPVICTYHPAYLLPHRSPEKKKDVWEDMKMLLAKMGKPIPTPKRADG